MLRLAMILALISRVCAQYSNVSGMVLPPSGNTIIRAAKVHIQDVTSTFNSDQEVDTLGSFSFTRIRDGKYKLIGKYEDPSYMPACSSANVPPDRAKIALVLQNPATKSFLHQQVID